MDLDEWELIPEDGLLQAHDDEGKTPFSRKYDGSDPSSILDMNHFQCPPQSSPKLPHQSGDRIAPVTVQPYLTDRKVLDDELLNVIPTQEIKCQKIKSAKTDPGTALQEIQLVDMKTNSPELRGVGAYPQIGEGVLQFKGETETMEGKNDSQEGEKEIVTQKAGFNSDAGMDVLKRTLTGIGAIFSFGAAAAAFFIIIIRNRHRGSTKLHHQNRKFPLQINPNEKGRRTAA